MVAFNPLTIIQLISEGWDHFVSQHTAMEDVGAWLASQTDLAVEKFSVDFPAKLVETVVTTDNYTSPVPSSWVNEFSEIECIEYPLGHRPRRYLLSKYSDYNTPTGYVIDYDETLSVGVSLDVHFTGVHRWHGSSPTLSQADIPLVRLLAGHVSAIAISGFYSDLADPSFSNSSGQANAGGLSGKWNNISENLIQGYQYLADRRRIKINNLQVLRG